MIGLDMGMQGNKGRITRCRRQGKMGKIGATQRRAERSVFVFSYYCLLVCLLTVWYMYDARGMTVTKLGYYRGLMEF